MIKLSAFIFLFINVSVFAQSDTTLATKITATQVWKLQSGDSIVIYESRIVSSDIEGPVSSSGTVSLNNLFSSHPNTKFYSRTSKYVIHRKTDGYDVICYVSDKNRYPNFGFDRQIKKDEKWHFKKYAGKKLSSADIKELCLMEVEAEKREIDQYDEGDVSKSITVIKHGKKVISSSYYAVYRLDKVMEMK